MMTGRIVAGMQQCNISNRTGVDRDRLRSGFNGHSTSRCRHGITGYSLRIARKIDIVSAEMVFAQPEMDSVSVGMGCATAGMDSVSVETVFAQPEMDTVSGGMGCATPEMDSVPVGMVSAPPGMDNGPAGMLRAMAGEGWVRADWLCALLVLDVRRPEVV